MGRLTVPFLFLAVVLCNLTACDAPDQPPTTPAAQGQDTPAPAAITEAADADATRERARRTRDYLERLDLAALLARGLQTAPAPASDAPADLAAAAARHAEEVEQAMEFTAGVDRAAVFEHLFETLTEDVSTDAERVAAVVRFVRRAGLRYVGTRPRLADGLPIDDPLVAIAVGWLHSAGGARVVCDILGGGGMSARIVEIEGVGVVGPEAEYGNAWHAIDLTAGDLEHPLPRHSDGTVPSWRDLAADPRPLDAMPFDGGAEDGGPPIKAIPARSTACFPAGARVWAREKRDAPAPADRNYGWRLTKPELLDWTVPGAPNHTLPGAPRWRRIRAQAGASGGWDIDLRWSASRDTDEDVVGYVVFVGSASRGWSYARYRGADANEVFWRAQPWTDDAVAGAQRLPPADVSRVETAALEHVVHVDVDAPIFVTVMAHDAYHDSVGRVRYPMSNELRLEPVLLMDGTGDEGAGREAGTDTDAGPGSVVGVPGEGGA